MSGVGCPLVNYSEYLLLYGKWRSFFLACLVPRYLPRIVYLHVRDLKLLPVFCFTVSTPWDIAIRYRMHDPRQLSTTEESAKAVQIA